MSKILNYKFLILFLILIIAAFLRLYNLTPQVGGLPPGLYPDEAMDGNNALEGFKIFYPENNGREGLFMNIQAVFLKVLMPLTGGNPEPWMLRIVSAIFGILTVLGVYFLAKELFRENPKSEILNSKQITNPNDLNSKRFRILNFKNWNLFSISNFEFRISRSQKIALLASFFLATSFWHINFSRISFRAIMAPFFMVWALYFLLKGLNSEKYKLASIIGGIFLGLGLHSYIAFRAMPLLIIIVWIFYWLKNKDKEFRKKIITSATLFTISALIVFAPLGIYFLKNPADFFGRTAELSITHSATPLNDLGMNIIKTAAMFNFVGDFNWRHNFAGSPELFWPVGIFFFIGIFLAVKYLIQSSKFKVQNDNVKLKIDSPQANTEILHFDLYILIFWLIIAALPVVISNEGIPHALRAILMAPPVFILASVGGLYIYELVKNAMTRHSTIWVFKVFIFIFLSILLFQAYYTYFIKWGQNPNVQGAFSADYVAIGRQLNSLPKELPKYVVVEASGVDVRGIPMPAQTVMYITDTFLPEKQKEKNIHYVLPSQINEIPPGSYVVTLK